MVEQRAVEVERELLHAARRRLGVVPQPDGAEPGGRVEADGDLRLGLGLGLGFGFRLGFGFGLGLPCAARPA